MKRLFIIAFLLFGSSCFANKLEPERDITKKVNLILKTDVLLPVITLGKSHTGEFSFTVERLFNKRHSFQLTFASFGNYKRNMQLSYGAVTQETNFDEHSIAIIPEYKFFVSKNKNHTGYYIGASAAYLLNAQNNKWAIIIPAGVSYNNTMGPATLSYHYKDNLQALAFGIINGFQYYLYNHFVLDF